MTYNNRILIVDDNKAIHEDFQKILAPPKEWEAFDALAREVFPDFAEREDDSFRGTSYELENAYQGEEAYRLVMQREAEGNPFAVVFMDVRMPPGWDGIETVKRIWADVPHLEVVICTAYSDYPWEKILDKLGTTDQLMFLRKPFDVISVKQMALALTKKWNLNARVKQHLDELELAVTERTRELTEKINELESANAEIRQLQGILPMCIYCHKIRDDENFWQRVDDYMQNYNIANISHSVCPDCYDRVMAQMLDEIKEEQKSADPEE